MSDDVSTYNSVASRAAAALRMLGLHEDRRDAVIDMHLTKLRRVAVVWQVSIVAVVASGAAGVAAAVVNGSGLAIGALAGTALLASLLVLWLLGVPDTIEYVVHQRMRALVFATGVIGASVFGMAWSVAQLPAGACQEAGMVAAAGALVAVAVAAMPVRAGTLGLGMGIVIMLAVRSGTVVMPLAALLSFACVAVGLIRLGRVDLRQALERADLYI